MLKYNTIAVRFLNVTTKNDHQLANGQKYFFNYDTPIKTTKYQFYLTDEQKKVADIGSIILNQHGAFKTAGVIVDNFTTYNAKAKHVPVTKITNHHLRGYIKTHFHNERFAEQAYYHFRIEAKAARIEFAKQMTALRKNNKQKR